MQEGLCGICGEPANSVKLWEKGGAAYRGTIVRTYTEGQTINAAVVVSSNF